METKPGLLGQCLTTTQLSAELSAGALFRAPGAFVVCWFVGCGPLQSSSGPWLHRGPAGAPVSAPVPRAAQVGKLCLLRALRHRDVTHSTLRSRRGPRLVCELSLSKSLRKSSHRYFGITFKLLESSCIFPPSSPPPSPCPSPLIVPPLSPKTFGNFEAGRTAV